jgi:hypothetical protein
LLYGGVERVRRIGIIGQKDIDVVAHGVPYLAFSKNRRVSSGVNLKMIQSTIVGRNEPGDRGSPTLGLE